MFLSYLQSKHSLSIHFQIVNLNETNYYGKSRIIMKLQENNSFITETVITEFLSQLLI